MPDPLYIAARRILLDALEAARRHLEAVVLVGAQAVYVYAGEADLAVAPYTTDGDLAIDPRILGPDPLLENALSSAGFRLAKEAVGVWNATVEVEGARRTVAVDLLIPESLGGKGRRGARIPPHSKFAARKVRGLEGALVDRTRQRITAFEVGDDRSFDLAVAGPAALIVAKVHKILDRSLDSDRSSDKDALDVYRLLRSQPTEDLVQRFELLRADRLSRDVTSRAVQEFSALFGTPRAPGCSMAVRSAAPLEPGDTLAASLASLAGDLLANLRRS